MSDMKR